MSACRRPRRMPPPRRHSAVRGHTERPRRSSSVKRQQRRADCSYPCASTLSSSCGAVAHALLLSAWIRSPRATRLAHPLRTTDGGLRRSSADARSGREYEPSVGSSDHRRRREPAAPHVALAAMRAITHVVGKAIGSSRRPRRRAARWLRRQLTSGPTGRPGADVEPSTARVVLGALLAIGVAPDRGRWRERGWCSVSVCESRRRVALAGRSDRVADGLSTRGAARGARGQTALCCSVAWTGALPPTEGAAAPFRRGCRVSHRARRCAVN